MLAVRPRFALHTSYTPCALSSRTRFWLCNSLYPPALHKNACTGGTVVQGVDDYCGEGYGGPREKLFFGGVDGTVMDDSTFGVERIVDFHLV